MERNTIKEICSSIALYGDESAVEKLYCYFFSGLFSFSNSIIHDKEISKEIISDVFLRIWETRKTLIDIDNISHYLYASVKNRCLNYLKSRAHYYQEISNPLDEAGDDIYTYSFCATTSLISKENLAAINTAIDKLPSRCRLIFRLIKEEGFRYSEVADLLHISEKTVENQMLIAFKSISAMLEITLPEYSHYYRKEK